MKIENPYHEGELQVQSRVGVLKEGEVNSRVIQDSILKGALRFLSQLPMAVLGSVDGEGQKWASVFLGEPGFMQAENDRTVRFDLTKTLSNPDDLFWKNIQGHSKVGMLAIELASRRRLRINGILTKDSDTGLTLQVEESYPNCPKYIQRRHPTIKANKTEDSLPATKRGNTLGPTQQALITRADTFFVASAHPERGVDASHRGGSPGFVTVENDRTLRIPDYPGNSMFNTLGNFTVDSRAGLLFMDYETGRTLQLTGEALIVYDQEGSDQVTGGTRRWWEFTVSHWRETQPQQPVTWELFDASPYNPSSVNGVE